MANEKTGLDKATVRRFEKSETQLDSLYEEIGGLSKKKPDEPVNKFKLKFVNQVLNDANEILGQSYRPFADFKYFNEEDLPTSSDVVMMLSRILEEHGYMGTTTYARSEEFTIGS